MKLGRLVANSNWDLLGNVLPLAAAVPCVPHLADQLGEARLGVLTIYSKMNRSLFDLGIGRAVSRLMAFPTLAGEPADLGAAVGTGLALVAGVGFRVLLAMLSVDLEDARSLLRRACTSHSQYAESVFKNMRLQMDARPDDIAALGPIVDEEMARRPSKRW